MYQLKIVIASTRPGRKGIYVADWFIEAVKKYPDFEVEVLDLAEINLPFIDEPNHPRLQKYEKDHTKEWSRKIDSADAFVVITPEYNYGMAPALMLVPLQEAVNFPFFEKRIDDNGKFQSDEVVDKSVEAMMNELLKWTKALKPMRIVPLT